MSQSCEWQRRETSEIDIVSTARLRPYVAAASFGVRFTFWRVARVGEVGGSK
jgi:hypothetical protein